MKTATNAPKFGFSAVNAGQRNVASEPQLIATSTLGGFRITPQVSKLLGIEPGEYVMFINNIDAIDEALRDHADVIVEFAEEAGLELDSVELAIAAHKEFDMWAIGKGVQLFTPSGRPLTITTRLSKKDKVATVEANFDEYLEKALASTNEDLVASLSVEGITRKEQVEILASTIKGDEEYKYQGSKTANPSMLTGVGVSLNFTDTNVWGQLKADLDDAEGVNRIYDIDLDDVQKAVVSNGCKNVEIDILPLGKYTDKKPAQRGKSAKDAE